MFTQTSCVASLAAFFLLASSSGAVPLSADALLARDDPSGVTLLPATPATAGTGLVPAIHPADDLTSVDNLKLNHNVSLFYGQENTAKPGMAPGAAPCESAPARDLGRVD